MSAGADLQCSVEKEPQGYKADWVNPTQKLVSNNLIGLLTLYSYQEYYNDILADLFNKL